MYHSTLGKLASFHLEDTPMQEAAIHKQTAKLAVPAIKQGSQSDDEGSVLLRKQIGTVAPLARSLSSPAGSPHPIKKTPASARILGKRKAFVFDGEDDSSEEQSLSPAPEKGLLPEPDHQNESREDRDARLRALRRKSGPQVLAEYQQYKGRGRYAAGPSKYDTSVSVISHKLNALLLIGHRTRLSTASSKSTLLATMAWPLSMTLLCATRMSVER